MSLPYKLIDAWVNPNLGTPADPRYNVGYLFPDLAERWRRGTTLEQLIDEMDGGGGGQDRPANGRRARVQDGAHGRVRDRARVRRSCLLPGLRQMRRARRARRTQRRDSRPADRRRGTRA